MMVMTAKVDFKKIIIGLIAAGAVIVALILLLGGNNDSTTTAASTVSGNEARVQFLTDLGWEVTTSPKQSNQVRIPKEPEEVFNRYNELQKSQGYDLSQYAGKTVMRYVYQINNYPGSTEPVYATLLVYKNQIIGGDITDTAPGGLVQGFKRPETLPEQTTVPQNEPGTTVNE